MKDMNDEEISNYRIVDSCATCVEHTERGMTNFTDWCYRHAAKCNKNGICDDFNKEE